MGIKEEDLENPAVGLTSSKAIDSGKLPPTSLFPDSDLTVIMQGYHVSSNDAVVEKTLHKIDLTSEISKTRLVEALCYIMSHTDFMLIRLIRR